MYVYYPNCYLFQQRTEKAIIQNGNTSSDSRSLAN